VKAKRPMPMPTARASRPRDGDAPAPPDQDRDIRSVAVGRRGEQIGGPEPARLRVGAEKAEAGRVRVERVDLGVADMVVGGRRELRPDVLQVVLEHREVDGDPQPLHRSR